MKALWRNRVEVQAVSMEIANAIDDLASAINVQPIELSLPNGKTTRIHAGLGSPEGVIVGSPGDLWLRTDGSLITTLYTKTSGLNSKTGWTGPEQDGAWTPIDGSGGGLTFTVVSAVYAKLGRLVYVSCDLVYPVTASGANARIGGLPFTTNSPQSALVQGYGTTATSARWLVRGSNTVIDPMTTAGANVTNVQLSGQNIVLSGTYLASA